MLKTLLEYLNLDSELDDYASIHDAIEKGVIFKGTNLWILVFAIVIASIGLNVNSTAVIIGAMLISPLMGPINGMGYSISTYDFELFRKSVKNFSFAVLASLLASTLYFSISPVSTAYSELLARTSPTIYDVLIALFGGLAGIVAMSSKQKGNVMPGVAIATALMPPLCTAGFGLATGQFTFFFGAFYLFTINTVFIALSSVAISRILKFPIRTVVDEKQRKRVNQWISFVITITVIPSIYFGYVLVQKERFTDSATRFVRNVQVLGGSYLLKDEIEAGKETITLVYGGTSLTEEQKNEIRAKALDFELEGVELVFQQGFSFDNLDSRRNEVDQLKAEINRLNLAIQERERVQDSLAQRSAMGRQLLTEIRAFYPTVQSCTFTETQSFSDTSALPLPQDLVVFHLKAELAKAEEGRILEWLKNRLQSKNLKVYFD